MADPVSYKMFAPNAAPLELAPIQEAARTSAAAILGAGQAIAEGIEKRAEESARSEAEDALMEITDDLSNKTNYKDYTLDPYAEDQVLNQFPPFMRVEVKARQLQAERGLSPEAATELARKLSEPITVRYLNPDKVGEFKAKSARALALATRAKIPQESAARMIELAGGAAELTQTEAASRAWTMYHERQRGPDASNREMALLEQGIKSKLMQEQAAQQAARDKEARLFEESQGTTAYERAVKLQELRAKAESRDLDKRLEAQERLAFMDADMRARLQNMEYGDRKRLIDLQGEIDKQLLQIKAEAAGGGNLTPAQAQAQATFGSMMTDSLVRGTAFEPVELSMIGSLDSSARDAFAKDAKGNSTVVIQLPGGGETKRVDAANILVSIGPDGEPMLTSKDGSVAEPELKAVKRKLFRSRISADAVVLQQIAGGEYNNKSDLEAMRADRNLLEMARAALARGRPKAPETPPTPDTEPKKHTKGFTDRAGERR